MKYTLVVIDMQSRFPASKKRSLLKNIKREISIAMENKCPIVFMEYLNTGPTLKSLVSMTDSYHNTFLIRKNKDDGSSQLLKCIKHNRLPYSNIKVCGVNTDCCVFDTVLGILCKKPKSRIHVPSKACNSSWDHKNGLRALSNLKQVKIV